MAAIDVGPGATDRTGSLPSGYTWIPTKNPANDTGTIDTVEIWTNSDLAGAKVGTFFLVSGTTYQCRDSANIGSVTAGSKQTFGSLSISVEAGDYLGIYSTSGSIEADSSGGAGLLYVFGEYADPNDSASYGTFGGYTVSIYATGATAGGPTKELAGSVSAASLATGTLRLNHSLVSSVAAASAITGTTFVAGTIWALSAAVAGQSAVAGGFGFQEELAGSVAAASTVAGSPGIIRAVAAPVPWLSGYDYVNDPYCVAFYNAETWDTYLDDQSGEGNHLQCTPQVNMSDKQEGDGCADFDNAVRPSGIDYADADLANGWPGKVGTGSKTFSVVFWFKAHDWPGVNYLHTLMGKGRATDTGWQINIYGDNKLYLAIANLLVTDWRGTVDTFGANIWYHVGVTYNNADLSYRIRVYDTYTSSNWADATGTMPHPMVLNSADFSIAYGLVRSTGSLVYQYDGLLDDLAVFNDVLSAPEIDNCRTGTHNYATDGNCMAHWGFNSANFPREDKGNLAVHEISVPKLDTTVYRMGAASMEFQQTNYGGAYIVDTATSANFPYKASTTNLEWSTAFWVRFRTVSGVQYLVSKYLDNTQGSVAVFLSGGAHGHVTLRVRYAASSQEDYTHTMEIGPLVWYHVVVAVSAAANSYLINVWDDDLKVETTVSGALLHDPLVSTEPWKLGSQQLEDSSLALDGWLDEVAIFNRAITPATIADLRLEALGFAHSTIAANLVQRHSMMAAILAQSLATAGIQWKSGSYVPAQTLMEPYPVPMLWNYLRPGVPFEEAAKQWSADKSRWSEEHMIRVMREISRLGQEKTTDWAS